MNCPEAEKLLHTAVDGGLSAAEQAALAQHVDRCAGCRQLQADLAAVSAAYRADAERIVVPDPDEEWRLLQVELRGAAQRERRAGRSPVSPWVKWFGTPLAAAAALALAFYAGRATALRPADALLVPEMARADFVEVADANATPIVFRDEESGWLVVWAEQGAAATHT